MSAATRKESSISKSQWTGHGVTSDTDPDSAFWHGVPAAFATTDTNGDPVVGNPMEVRSRWTSEYLYFLFLCPYEKLYLNAHPQAGVKTNGLWLWDVAEIFIGSDPDNIARYKEFEVSPQGEWLDLDIDLNRTEDSHDWKWISGFQVSARIDPTLHRWFGFMRIPYASVDSRPAAIGNTLRINFFLSAGPEAEHRTMAWQPTFGSTFHVPEVFGELELIHSA